MMVFPANRSGFIEVFSEDSFFEFYSRLIKIREEVIGWLGKDANSGERDIIVSNIFPKTPVSPRICFSLYETNLVFLTPEISFGLF